MGQDKYHRYVGVAVEGDEFGDGGVLPPRMLGPATPQETILLTLTSADAEHLCSGSRCIVWQCGMETA